LTALDGGGVHVGADHGRAVEAQDLGQAVAGGAEALHRDLQAGELHLAAGVREARLHRVEAALAGVRARVAAVADRLAAHDVRGLLRHPVAVLRVDAHVLGGDVLAAEGVDEAAHGAGLGLGRGLALLDHDHALGPAHRQVGRGRLVGHALGEAQHVADRLALVGIGPATGAAERVAEHR